MPASAIRQRLTTLEQPGSPFVWTFERGSPFTTAGFARMRAGVEAKLGFKAQPHMLRHACGFALSASISTFDRRAIGKAAMQDVCHPAGSYNRRDAL